MILTHVEKADVDTTVIIGVLNSSDAGAGVRFDIQIAEGSLVPACARSVAILLDDVAGVEVVQADLLAFPLASELGKYMEPLASPALFQLTQASGEA